MDILELLEETDEFSLDQDEFEEKVTKVIRRLKEETYVLRTGLQYQNEILGGGYFGGRLYTYMALPANFKSGILLKAARDIKKYNRGIQTRSGKQPTVLLITCENNVDETLERLFLMTSSNNEMTSYSTAEAIRLLKEVGEMTITEENNINIIIRYFPNFAISTGDIYTMIDDLADEIIEMNEDTNGAVEVARRMYPETNTNYGVVSTLTYGVQWDRTLAWWGETEAQNGTKDVTIDSITKLNDSTLYGNYVNNEIPNSTFNSGASVSKNGGKSYTTIDSTYSKTSSNSHLLTTGATEETKINNIYDMAGNMGEWTMEGSGTNNRVHRGGSFSIGGGDNPVSNRYSVDDPVYAYNDDGFRPALYIKK